MKKHYDSRLASMDADVADALRRADAEKARADKAEAARQRLAQENADLQRQLNDCQQSKVNVVVEKPEHTVLFDNNSSYFTKEQAEALKAFAEQYKGKKLSLVAEASRPGSKEHNQRLSERRLERVIKALQEVGFAEKDLKPSIAIGAQRGIDSAEARRVTITVE
jgi:outer membrane protein OmpA-like peptidoglycan-associated protein